MSHPCRAADTYHATGLDLARRNVVYRAYSRLADGTRTIGEISDIIANAYGISPFRVRLDVRSIVRMSA